ncbi:MAG: serine/threonine-protein phosphatase [Actinomycetota bacterium]|nr:serine/threonine-protein phosphatase [Actinomycetota bacterium]
MAPAATAEISALLANTSARTLMLGIDKAGRIRQHDRAAADVLSDVPSALLGTDLGSLLAGPEAHATALQGLIDGACSGREGTTVLTVRTARGTTADGVVTVQPVRSADPELVAQVILRIPPPLEERFLDPAVMRHAMLDGALRRIGGELDMDQMAPELINVVVPHFCNAAGLLIRESLIGDEDAPTDSPDGSQLLRRLAVAHDDDDGTWDATFPTGEVLRYPPDTPYTKCMTTGLPVSEILVEATADKIADAWIRQPVSDLLGQTSLLVLPLIARGIMLGFFVCIRLPGYRRFDAYDTELGMEFASRAAMFMDNAQRYSRERATALTLQRSMLPTGLSAPSSVEVKHRYLPGSQLIEIGGDWYESIALPGGRVALVVGDVAGHGVRAAVTMGRLRTAIHTLAMLELPPAETLQQLNELMQELGVREPHFATCVYAIYDAVSGSCELASAGHLPPLLVRPDGTTELLDISPAPPLGVGSGPIQSRVVEIDDGSLLVLYTDGLVERRTEDIDVGLAKLREIFGPGSADRPLEDLCKATLAGVYADQQRDDIALLIARLRRIPEDNFVTWKLSSELTSAHRARTLIRRPMKRWGLTELIPAAELLASELVTNAVRYAQGQIGLRLILEGGLVIEVLDDSAALPRLRHPDDDEERGRGLQVVSQIAQRWGARRAVSGKIVWCELALPRA